MNYNEHKLYADLLEILSGYASVSSIHRWSNALWKAGYTDINQVLSATDSELEQIPRIGAGFITILNHPNDVVEDTEVVYHPQHYQTQSGYESQDYIDKVVDGLPAREAVCLAHILRYFFRCDSKHAEPWQDLAKANNYAHRMIYGHWREK